MTTRSRERLHRAGQILAAAAISLVAIGAHAAGTITGTVFYDRVNTGVIDVVPGAGDTPLGAVVVELRNSGGTLITTATADGYGLYTFPAVADGSYQLTSVIPVGSTSVTDADGNTNGTNLIAVTVAGAAVPGRNFLITNPDPKNLLSYNPTLVQGIVGEGATAGTPPALVPSTLLPQEFNGTGQIWADVGNSGDTPLHLLGDGERMRIVITLSKGVPNVANPNDPTQALTALSGAGAAWFDWTYDPTIFTYQGLQNQVIPGQGRETIIIQYKVTVNSFLAAAPTVSNGFNSNLNPPPYTNPQPTDDDTISAYTYVAASDYSDAPNTYGAVWHNVNVEKRTDGRYLNYVRIGSIVDPETQMSYSPSAVGDDDSKTGGLNTDDEDGVTFPPMNPGSSVQIPVVLTFPSTFMTLSYLHAWIDWDRNGTFDPSEKVYTSVGTRTSGTVNIPVTVPPTAPQGWYVARFRVGPDANAAGDDELGPTGAAAWGEVEDHMFPVGNPTAVTMGDVDLIATGVPAFLRDVGANDLDAAGLLGWLRSWDPIAAVKLQGAGREALLTALRDYLDPDGDGQVVVFRWETLEERGTVGFYAERSQDGVWSRINGEMLPGLIAAPMGAQYWQADPGAQVGDDNQYRLIEVEARGRTNEYGPFDLRATPR